MTPLEFVQELAAEKLCEEDSERCELQSGPYCGTHLFDEYLITKAREALAAGQASAVPPSPDHSECHDLVCNCNRAQHPRGAKGVGCSCRGREERLRKELAKLKAEASGVPASPQSEFGLSAAATRKDADKASSKAECLTVAQAKARCLDCGLSYADFPLDLLLPRAQWLDINPADSGLLCAACIVKRCAELPGACVVHAVVEIVPPGKRTCDGCEHLQKFDATKEYFNCPVVNIRVHESQVSDFGCTLWEAKTLPDPPGATDTPK